MATDFLEGSISAVRNALELLNTISENVILLHVNLPNLSFLSSDEIDRRVSEFLKLADLEDRNVNVDFIAEHNVEDGVRSYARRINADALGMITHGRKGLSHFFGGSISEDLVNHAKLPVITFRK